MGTPREALKTMVENAHDAVENTAWAELLHDQINEGAKIIEKALPDEETTAPLPEGTPSAPTLKPEPAKVEAAWDHHAVLWERSFQQELEGDTARATLTMLRAIYAQQVETEELNHYRWVNR